MALVDLDSLARRNSAEAYERRRRTLRQGTRLRLLQIAGAATRAPDARPGEFGRLLVIRPDHLGDLLFTTPALRVLRKAFPAAEITALVGPWGTSVMEGNPDIDELVALPFPGFERDATAGFNPAAYRLLSQRADVLRGRFDAALVLRYDHWWGAWLAQAAGILARVGYATPETAPFLTATRPHKPGRHEVLQNLELVNELIRIAGGTPPPLPAGFTPDLRLTSSLSPNPLSPLPAEGDWVSERHSLPPGEGRGGKGVRGEVAIHPGAGAAVKRWRPEAWAEVANTLAAEFGVTVVLTGSGAERELCEQVAAGVSAGATNLAGATSLPELAAVYARCRLVLGPDCGPLHLAVAVGTPTVHLFGPADPVAFGPWGPPARHRVVTPVIGCAPCSVLSWDDELDMHPCVRAIPAASVLAAARAVLGAA